MVRRVEVELLSLVTRSRQNGTNFHPLSSTLPMMDGSSGWLHCMHHAHPLFYTGNLGFVLHAAGPASINYVIQSLTGMHL